MVDTARTLVALQSIFSDGQLPGSITPQDVRDLIVSVLNIVPAVVSAAGTTQGTATVLTAQVNIVTSCASGAGVKVTSGYTEVWNRDAVNDCLAYPVSGANFEGLSANAPVSIPSGGSAQFNMINSTQGYVR